MTLMKNSAIEDVVHDPACSTYPEIEYSEGETILEEKKNTKY